MHDDLSHLPLHDRLAHWIAELAHVLPAQAPIRDFVHHNTLHGFQHLPFPQALAAAQALSGAAPYWSLTRFQAEFSAGRINRADLLAVLQDSDLAGLDELLVADVRRADVLLASLLLPEHLPVAARAYWQRQEGLPAKVDPRLFALCRQLTETASAAKPTSWEKLAIERCLALFSRLDEDWTLRDLLLHLSGEDVLEQTRAMLQHHLAAHLDLGLAAWSNPARAQGFYAAWRASAAGDFGWDVEDMPSARHEIADLPASALEALMSELSLCLPQEALWPAYLQKLALELPGWSGMFLWRDQHAVGRGEAGVPVQMVDYLAVRAVLERLLCSDLIQRMTGTSLAVDALQDYFLANAGEFYVRDALARGALPEDLQHRAACLLGGDGRADAEAASAAEWILLAEALAQAPASPDDERAARLAALLQALALPAETLAQLSSDTAALLLQTAAQLAPLPRRYLCLQAYERHYREEIFHALRSNAVRCQTLSPTPTPASTQKSMRKSAQVVMCMDDREEGTRRHLEEIAPTVATFGAAGFFGVAMYWQGLDDAARTALCPVLVQPAHVVQEVPQAAAFAAAVDHAGRREMRLRWRDGFYQKTCRHVLWGPLLTAIAGLPALLALLFNTLAPATFGETLKRWRQGFDGQVATRLELTAAVDDRSAGPASAEQVHRGFTTLEQVDRVESFLRTIGLTQDFAPLVLMLGHGSGSQNNPHLSAYACGACSGRHGGPNARVFAAMANRPEVRVELLRRGLQIPEDCWFIAAEHNTCDDSIEWYDREQLPVAQQAAFDTLLGQLSEACRAHAVERCRRLASAPLGMSPWQAERHVRGRRYDISQVRPELGHANNACALVGRRAMSQGLFLDRRAFLVSYDPLADVSGDILEKILLAVGPVGAGINLEYYFSTVDNQRFGCGSKITHNLTGLFGVMEGADSDLRTGLPWQMVEIHEPMRLLLVVEQTPTVLTRILGDQPGLQELINNAWIILAAQDPSTAAIQLYCPRRGWLPWSEAGLEAAVALPQVACSQDWFAGARGPLAPAILRGGVA